MDERHAYWLAALIDGEGSILLRKRSGHHRLFASIVIAQNDRRLLDRAAEYAGCGEVYTGQGPRKTGCQLHIHRQTDVLYVLTAIEPLLVLKREKAIEVLEYLLKP